MRLHLTFIFLLFFLLLTNADEGGSAGLVRSVALIAIIFGSVAAHEIAHLLVATKLGLRIQTITLFPIGGVQVLDSPGETTSGASPEVTMALAGPAANLIIAMAASGLAGSVQPPPGFWNDPHMLAANLPLSLFWINLYLAAFNLLPAYPTDGGRALRAIFARHMNFLQATRRAVTLGHLFAMGFILLGIRHQWLMLSGLFLFVAAQLEDRSLTFQSAVESVCMEDVMLTEFSTLSPSDTLEDALGKTIHTLQDDFPVVRGNDLVGIITRQRIAQVLRLEGNGYVQAIMSRAFDVAERRESLANAFRKIAARNLTLIPVVDQNRLVGIVTLQNLMHSMAVLAESKKLRRRMES